MAGFAESAVVGASVVVCGSGPAWAAIGTVTAVTPTRVVVELANETVLRFWRRDGREVSSRRPLDRCWIEPMGGEAERQARRQAAVQRLRRTAWETLDDGVLARLVTLLPPEDGQR